MAFVPWALLGQHPDEDDGPSQYVTTTAPGVLITSPVRTMPATARRGLSEDVRELEGMVGLVPLEILRDRARALYMRLRGARDWSGAHADQWEDKGELLARLEAMLV